MARKSLGFVPLIWECPYCKTQNPGPIKTCTSCGAPQPEDVEFLQVDEEKFNFIKDETLIRMAKAGPDIHCPYCGTRNPSTAQHCSNCGGDLSLGGKARESGQRVLTAAEASAQQAAVPTPPAPKSSQINEAPPKGRSFLFALIAILVVVACIIAVFFFFIQGDTLDATVSGLAWERSIAIEAYTQSAYQDWRDDIPANAEIQTCSDQYRYTSDQPEANATEVCGEAYVEDTGTGVGEVVQECTYEVYDSYCDYTVMEWVVVDVMTETGEDPNPFWPVAQLAADEREGERSEEYVIYFRTDKGTYTYASVDMDYFLQADPGSDWTLEVNQAGRILSLEPSY